MNQCFFDRSFQPVPQTYPIPNAMQNNRISVAFSMIRFFIYSIITSVFWKKEAIPIVKQPRYIMIYRSFVNFLKN